MPLIPHPTGRVYTVKAKLAGEPLFLCVDGGAECHLGLRYAAMSRLGFDVKPPIDGEERRITSFQPNIGTVDGLCFEDSEYEVPGKTEVGLVGGLRQYITRIDSDSGKFKETLLDGLLGQKFLHDHSAIIDTTTNTLYLMPRAKRLFPAWGGRWECVGGERDGKPLTDADRRWVVVNDDLTVDIHFLGKHFPGTLEVTPYGGRLLFFVNSPATQQPTLSLLKGISKLDGDTLTLCLFDNKAANADAAIVQDKFPKEFAAEVGSGYVVYKFKRKPGTKPEAK